MGAVTSTECSKAIDLYKLISLGDWPGLLPVPKTRTAQDGEQTPIRILDETKTISAVQLLDLYYRTIRPNPEWCTYCSPASPLAICDSTTRARIVKEIEVYVSKQGKNPDVSTFFDVPGKFPLIRYALEHEDSGQVLWRWFDLIGAMGTTALVSSALVDWVLFWADGAMDPKTTPRTRAAALKALIELVNTGGMFPVYLDKVYKRAIAIQAFTGEQAKIDSEDTIYGYQAWELANSNASELVGAVSSQLNLTASAVAADQAKAQVAARTQAEKTARKRLLEWYGPLVAAGAAMLGVGAFFTVKARRGERV